ncbi:uncharacterized protein PAC_06902 [Phialocephala subalpina]|uniref:Uncharacterized protein n=1 Tax=Phialocephala subalpina TaxID=576137 RepID=A0A1L7WW89_9HELO|nr:uncharacterized protein PAC_06902 [Phialocephala subalpina]
MGKWSARYTAHNHCWSNLSGSARYAADKLSSSTWTCEHLLLDTGPLPKQLQDIPNTWVEFVLQHDQSRMAAYPAQDNAIRVDLFERLTFRPLPSSFATPPTKILPTAPAITDCSSPSVFTGFAPFTNSQRYLFLASLTFLAYTEVSMKVLDLIIAFALGLAVGVMGDTTSFGGITMQDAPFIGPTMASSLPDIASQASAIGPVSTGPTASVSATTTAAILSECDVVNPTFPIMPWMREAEITCQVTTLTAVSVNLTTATTTATATITQAASTVTKTLSLQVTTFSTMTAMCVLANGIAAPCTTAVNAATHTSAGPAKYNPFYWIAEALTGVCKWLKGIFEVKVPKVIGHKTENLQ